MIRELMGPLSNEYDGTLRGKPTQWTKEVWRKVYGFQKGGQGTASRKEDFSRGEFSGKPDPKEGFSITDCIDDKARAVLSFLIPIFYPEKPTRVTGTWASTILGSFRMKREVD